MESLAVPVRIDHPALRVARIVLDRAGARNAINLAMRDALLAALEQVMADDDVRAVILTGAGGHFSAGGDIGWMRTMQGDGFLAYHRETLAIVRMLAGSAKPVVAAVEGACAGGGAGFALAADHVVMGRRVRFGVPFLRIALVPDMGAAWLLSRRMGWQRARQLVQDASIIDGLEAERLGIADEVVDDAQVQARALEHAQYLAKLPPRGFAQTKWLFNQTETDLNSFLEAELAAQAPCLTGDEFAEGCAAFLEKRQPEF